MQKDKKQDLQRLRIWKERLGQSDTAYADVVEKMDSREALYRGDRNLKPLVEEDKKAGTRESRHVRNIIFENVETQISSSIPQPKVTPKREKDEHLAQIIEHFLRNELDRLPFEEMNDMAERTVPIQGGVGFLVEWDSTSGDGDLAVSVIHPKQFGPQPGVYTSVEDMDWFILKQPSTKNAVRRRYGKSIYSEGEAEPELRSTGAEDQSDDAVTVYIGYEVSDDGGINKFTWVNDVVLEALENYQARRQPVCKHCGRMKPLPGQRVCSEIHLQEDPGTGDLEAMHAFAEGLAGQVMGHQEPLDLGLGAAEDLPGYDGGSCPWCGCEEFAEAPQEYEQIEIPMMTPGGVHIPGAAPGVDDAMQPVMVPTKVPFYRPDCMPIVLQRSVSVFGQLLGNSDVDMIADQQNTINRIEQKVIDRLLKAGSRVCLPKSLSMSPKDGEIWHLDKPSEKEMIGLYEFKGDLQYEMVYLNQVYEESRQILGITDSYQGRRDPTATSGVAKERSAAQAAGRMESKRVMKNAAYARLFEVMFKFALAYSDVPKEVSFKNHKGQTEYEQFNRYDFLEDDGNGGYVWNDQFLFSCDTSAPLASNREAMWQETRMNLQTGAFGNPQATETLILFWDKMEQLHYPGAASTKKYLEDRLQREQQLAMQVGPSGTAGTTGGAPEAMNMASIAQGG